MDGSLTRNRIWPSVLGAWSLSPGPKGKVPEGLILIVELSVYLFMEEKSLVEKKLRIQERGGVADEETGRKQERGPKKEIILRKQLVDVCMPWHICFDASITFPVSHMIHAFMLCLLMIVQHPLISAYSGKIYPTILNYREFCGQISSEYLWNNTGVHL